MEQAAEINTPSFIHLQNIKLGKEALNEEGVFLTGDEVLHLVHIDNPDDPGTSPTWLSGPAPINYFKQRFTQVLTDQREHGKVHYMVVNTDPVFSITPAYSGTHWFLVAWIINTAGEEK